jgi:hypothetical protein
MRALTCGHSFCESCVVIHGVPIPKDPWSFSLDTCPLCQNRQVCRIRLKPYTAGVRGLQMIGNLNGNRPLLQFLHDLQSHLNLKVSLRDHFDIVTGSGDGGVFVVDELFATDRTIQDCLDLGKHLSARLRAALNGLQLSQNKDPRRFFVERPKSSTSTLARLVSSSQSPDGVLENWSKFAYRTVS